MTLEILGIFLFRHRPMAALLVEFVFVILANALMLAAAAQRVIAAVSLRRYWSLISAAYLLTLIAYLIRVGSYCGAVAFHGGVSPWADFTDVIMIFSFVPHFILSSQTSDRSYPKTFFWIDALQTLVLAYLIYLKLYGVIPFTDTVVHPVGGNELVAFYVITDFLLPLFYFLRYLAATTSDDRRFYRALVTAMSVSAVCLSIGEAVGHGAGNAAYTDVLAPASMLFIYIVFRSVPAETPGGAELSMTPGRISKILNIVCPAFLTLALFALGIDISRHFFRFGMGTIAMAFGLHLLRNTILQLRVEASERSLRVARNQLEVMSLTDSLTGVANRRCFDRTLESDWNRAVRTRYTLALLMVDIDFFKTFNDHHGHQAGDKCLVRVAAALKSCLPRSGDLLARYGGEEFGVILPTINEEGSRIVATRMQEAVAALRIENETAVGRYLSLSIGIAVQAFPNESTAAQLLAAADRALYLAKESGRNRFDITIDSDVSVIPVPH